MSGRTLAPDEEEALRRIGNAVYDILSGYLLLSEQRTDNLSRKAVAAVRKALEDGE